MNNFFLIMSLFLLPSLSYAQNFGDCSSAFHLVDFTQTLEFQPNNNGLINDDFNTEDCISSESLSTWIKFTIPEDGNFFFTITPKNGDDIDFAVYKTPSLDDCTIRETIRCMASGQTIGTDSSACMGDTGLSEDDTDTEELPGCSPDDNNFLAAIDAQAGETYLLFINNFTSSGAPFCIQFFGSGIDGVLSISDIDNTNRLNLYPNPAHNLMYTTLPNGTRYSIINQLGLAFNAGLVNNGQIDISMLSKGSYLLEAEGDYRAFIKI